MSLTTHRLGATDEEPHTLEVDDWVSGSNLLWHLSSLPGLRVIAKKSWVLTDDFEAYFLYRDRAFVLYSPHAKMWISLMGQPPDEHLFAEVEARVKSYPSWKAFLILFSNARYFFKPFNPPARLVRPHGDSEIPRQGR
jgi:hypothetical protein